MAKKTKATTEPEEPKAVKAFDVINEIMVGKRDLTREGDETVAALAAFVPRLSVTALSQHIDTVMAANEMNRCHQLDPQLVHDYMLHSVRGYKRRHSWVKRTADELVDELSARLLINARTARDVVRVLGIEVAREIAGPAGE